MKRKLHANYGKLDIIHGVNVRKCTCSLFRGPSLLPLSLCFSFIFFVQAMPVAAMPLQRKKSLPDVAQPIQLTATAPLSREEVSILSSLRREEIRRQIDESERLRANPLLYLVSPQVKVNICPDLPEIVGERRNCRSVWPIARQARE